MRALFCALTLILATGCTTLSTLEGARTLEPGQYQIQVGTSAQSAGNPLSAGLGFPLPQLEAQIRVGLADDLDMGYRFYLLGTGFDLRYRFFQDGDWHMAVSPGLSGFWLPQSTALGSGSVELDVPLAAEYVFHPHWSVAFGPRGILRMQWNAISSRYGAGAESRLDGYMGGFARLEFQHGWFAMGLSADLYGQPIRQSVAAGSVSIDLMIRKPARASGAASR